MQSNMQRDRNDGDPVALVAILNDRYNIIAEAAEAAHAEFLVLRGALRTGSEHIRTSQRRWEVLEKQCEALAAKLDQLGA